MNKGNGAKVNYKKLADKISAGVGPTHNVLQELSSSPLVGAEKAAKLADAIDGIGTVEFAESADGKISKEDKKAITTGAKTLAKAHAFLANLAPSDFNKEFRGELKQAVKLSAI